MPTEYFDRTEFRAGVSFGNIPTAKTATYQILESDGSVIPYSAAGGSFTITLPPSARFKNGAIYKIVATASNGANTATIAASGSDTINGAATSTLLTGATRTAIEVTLLPGGTDWLITGGTPGNGL